MLDKLSAISGTIDGRKQKGGDSMKNTIKKGFSEPSKAKQNPKMTDEIRPNNYTINGAVLSTFEPYCSILNNIGSGEENAIHLCELRTKTNLAGRRLRKCIEDLRRSGTVIISSPKGYFTPQCRSEVEKYIRQETHRAKSVFYTLKAARKYAERLEGVK